MFYSYEYKLLQELRGGTMIVSRISKVSTLAEVILKLSSPEDAYILS